MKIFCTIQSRSFIDVSDDSLIKAPTLSRSITVWKSADSSCPRRISKRRV